MLYKLEGLTVPLGLCTLMHMQNEKGRVGAIYIRQNGYFLAWSILEGPCLWTLHTLMNRQSEQGRVATMYLQQNTGYFLRDLYLKAHLWARCTLMHMQSEKGRVAMK